MRKRLWDAQFFSYTVSMPPKSLVLGILLSSKPQVHRMTPDLKEVKEPCSIQVRTPLFFRA